MRLVDDLEIRFSNAILPGIEFDRPFDESAFEKVMEQKPVCSGHFVPIWEGVSLVPRRRKDAFVLRLFRFSFRMQGQIKMD